MMPVRSRVRGILGAVFVLTITLVSGCSGDDETPAPLTNDGMRQLEREKWEYTQKELSACMKDAGFRYFPVGFDEDKLDIPTGDDRDARYLEVTLTATDAKQKGFGVVAGGQALSSQDETQDKNAEYATSLSPSDYAAYQLALEGDGGGCRQSADDAAAKKYEKRLTELTGSADSLRTYVFTSPEFRRISSGWTACMGERGWSDAEITEFDSKIRAEAQQRLDAAAITDSGDDEGTEPPVVRYPPEELDEIRSYEVGAAVDYVECFDKFRGTYEELLDDAYDHLP